MISSIFLQLQDNLANREKLIRQNRSQSEINVLYALKERLETQSLIRSQKIATNAFKLSVMIEQTIAQTQQKANLVILFSIIGFTVFSSYISFLSIRSITRPINELIRGADVIGKGDLEHKIDLKTKNEMDELAVAFNDMTEKRKQAEEALKKAYDKLEVKVAERTKELYQANIQLKELDQLKSMFIASMSHELRTPLNSIIGFTGIILQGIAGEITEEQKKQLTMVKNSANHLLSLINDIIDVSKIEAGKVELFIEEFDLIKTVQEIKDSFKVAVDEKGLKMLLELPRELVIKSDERRVKQIIMNFVSNAVKFTDEGKIEIKASKKDEMVDIYVRDTGIGMRKEDINRLFNAFSQIPIEGRTEEGTGLGLYLSKKIADLLGGDISAESGFGKGSEFTFTLPLVFTDNHR